MAVGVGVGEGGSGVGDGVGAAVGLGKGVGAGVGVGVGGTMPGQGASFRKDAASIGDVPSIMMRWRDCPPEAEG